MRPSQDLLPTGVRDLSVSALAQTNFRNGKANARSARLPRQVPPPRPRAAVAWPLGCRSFCISVVRNRHGGSLTVIIINNGFNKFHLAPGAAELARRELLSAFATGAYPTVRVERWLNVLGLADNRKFARLLARAEPIPDRLVYADGISESLHVAASWLRRWRFTRAAGEWANEQSLKWYGQRAQQSVRHAIKSGARLYHYRAGFGHASVRLAKRHGLFALCDHSIAHPAMLEQLIAENGRWPTQARRAMPAAGIWRDIQRDIEQADAVLVNSDFVKETFLQQGWEPNRVHVIYLGVDDAFLDGASRSQSSSTDHGSTLRIVFAGGFELRKGARVLAAAMDELLTDKGLDFELHMAGGIGQDAQEELAALRQRGKVYHHGMLSRQELASLLAFCGLLRVSLARRGFSPRDFRSTRLRMLCDYHRE